MFYRHRKFVKWADSRDHSDPRSFTYLQYIKRVSAEDLDALNKTRIRIGMLLESIYKFQNGYDNVVYGKARQLHNEVGNIINKMEDIIERNREEREEHVRSRWEYKNGY